MSDDNMALPNVTRSNVFRFLNKMKNDIKHMKHCVYDKELDEYYFNIKELLIQDGVNIDYSIGKRELQDKLYYKLFNEINDELEKECRALNDATCDTGIDNNSVQVTDCLLDL